MKKFLLFVVGLLSILAVLGAVLFSGAWFMQARYAKQQVEDFFTMAKAQGYDIGYESLETAGFPINLTITIVKPHYKVRLDSLLKANQEKILSVLPPNYQRDAVAQDIQALPEWTEEGTVATLTYGINFASDKVFMLVDGGTPTQTSTIGTDVKNYTAEIAPGSNCGAEMVSTGMMHGLWSAGLIIQDWQTALNNLRIVHCDFSARTLKDSSGDVLASNDKISFSLSTLPDKDMRSTQLTFSMPRISGTAALDAYMNRYRALMPHVTQLQNAFSYAMYGDTSVDFAMSMHHPTALQQLGPQLPFNITIERFAFKNNLSTQTLDMLLDYQPQPAHVTAKLNLDATVTPEYDTLFNQLMLQQFRQMKSAPNPQMAVFQQTIASYTDEQLDALFTPLLFSIHYLSPIGLHIDGNSMQEAGAPPNVIINNAEISLAPYGIKAVGNIQLAKPSHVTLTCRNLLALLDDVFGYYARVRSVGVQILPDHGVNLPNPSAQLIAGMKQLLTTVAAPQKDPAGNDMMVYEYVSDAAGMPSINSKPMNELMALYQQDVAAYLNPPAQPPAPAPQAAPAKPLVKAVPRK